MTGNGLFTPIDPTFSVPAYNNSATQSFDTTSDFNSYELNYRIERRLARDRLVYTRDSTWIRQAAPALLPAVSAGIRVANVNETLSWFALANNPLEKGSYRVQTRNTLVGPQAGFDVFFERTDWRVGIKTKAAMVVNWDAQSSQVSIVDANGNPLVPNRNESTKAHDAAFIGELNFVGAYHIRPRFALRFSYDLMWVTNLALAQNQLTFDPASPPKSPTATRSSIRGYRSAASWFADEFDSNAVVTACVSADGASFAVFGGNKMQETRVRGTLRDVHRHGRIGNLQLG